jgi:hypothetical protein
MMADEPFQSATQPEKGCAHLQWEIGFRSFGCLLPQKRSQKIQHDPIEFGWFLHEGMMRGLCHDHRFRDLDLGGQMRERIGRVLCSQNDKRRHANLRQTSDHGRREWHWRSLGLRLIIRAPPVPLGFDP